MAERKLHQLTVDELTFRISSLLLQDPVLQSVVVKGELAELKKHTSGHVYFTLLGGESRISCALFRNYIPYVPQWPRNGDEVLAEGAVSLYPPRGAYQLIVRRLVPLGQGAAERARLELEQRLEAEGLFDVRLKRPLPLFPEKVAVVTSRTGAALRDVIAVAGKRMPSCALVVVPAQVQGYEAPGEICSALANAGRVEGAECVLLVRGGGSRDDLTPFDDERVVRQATRTMLERHGYRVLEARDGEDALERFEQHAGEVAVVVVDLLMPHMDGVELTRQLRDRLEPPPIVAMTGVGNSPKVTQVKELGGVQVLEKPFTAEVLLQAIGRVLRRETGVAGSWGW